MIRQDLDDYSLDDILSYISDLYEEEYLSMGEQVKIKYWPGAPSLDGDLKKGGWIDLYVYEDIELKAGEFKAIPLGIAMKLPEFYEAIIAPRSSTFKNWGILQANSIGVVDNSYSGSNDMWKFAAYATKDISVPKGTRLCQFRLQPMQLPVKFISVNELEDEDRGGFGSTGL